MKAILSIANGGCQKLRSTNGTRLTNLVRLAQCLVIAVIPLTLQTGVEPLVDVGQLVPLRTGYLMHLGEQRFPLSERWIIRLVFEVIYV